MQLLAWNRNGDLQSLIRGRAGIKLTSNGERVLRHIQEMLKWNEQMMQEIASIKGLEIGTVRIGTFSSVSIQWLPEILKSFNEIFLLSKSSC